MPTASGLDTLQQGYWKKGAYAGKYLTPFTVHTRTKKVVNITCRKINTTANEIMLTLESTTGAEVNGFSESGFVVDKPVVTQFELIRGNFQRQSTEDRQLKKTGYRYEVVDFPFRANFHIGTELVELEIFEAGNWLVEIKLNQ
jgi:hypothetical protein